MWVGRRRFVANIQLARFWSIVVCRLGPCLCLLMLNVASPLDAAIWQLFCERKKTKISLLAGTLYVTPLTLSSVGVTALLV